MQMKLPTSVQQQTRWPDLRWEQQTEPETNLVLTQASAEKSQRALTGTLNELTKKIEEVNLNLGDFEAGKRRITAENADLLRQLQELNANASLMTKTKSALVSALDEQKAIADNEAKERVSLLGKFRYVLSLLSNNLKIPE